MTPSESSEDSLGVVRRLPRGGSKTRSGGSKTPSEWFEDSLGWFQDPVGVV